MRQEKLSFPGTDVPPEKPCCGLDDAAPRFSYEERSEGGGTLPPLVACDVEPESGIRREYGELGGVPDPDERKNPDMAAITVTSCCLRRGHTL
jgi:hypothetical protein